MKNKTGMLSRTFLTLALLSVALLLITGCGGEQAAEQGTTTSAPDVATIVTTLTTTHTPPSTETTSTTEPALPPIPEMFPDTDEAESEWQQQILGSWSRTMEDQSIETVTFKTDNTLFFTYGDTPDKIRVGTYICEQGGTLALFTLSYVEGEEEQLLNLRKIEVGFPAPGTLVLDIRPAKLVWTYERVE